MEKTFDLQESGLASTTTLFVVSIIRTLGFGGMLWSFDDLHGISRSTAFILNVTSGRLFYNQNPKDKSVHGVGTCPIGLVVGAATNTNNTPDTYAVSAVPHKGGRGGGNKKFAMAMMMYTCNGCAYTISPCTAPSGQCTH